MRRVHVDTPVFWHVMARGARRLGIFWDAEDFQLFLSLLGASAAAADCRAVAYTLMTNHYHLILQATSLAISACMKRLNYAYSRYHNEKHQLSGHTFDGPYQRYIQPTPRLALSKVAYVFANPVRAGLTGSPAEYRWSNYADFAGGLNSPLALDPSPLLCEVARTRPEGARLFARAMDLELRRQERRKAGLPTAREIQSLHFEWFKDLADEKSDHLGGEDPTLVAMLWARSRGISPAAMALTEPWLAPAQISRLLWEAKKRLSNAGQLARLMALAG